ncbi:PilZ domain-containing protein [Pseudodesulfovibrio sediminis]|uniref:PilZ domain-containing protein n=1 Tax=Pseudodesulfovibrio sediminis TaxID=2810563 RepID=A0ABN6EQG6_9BACT|nr:PilZ domain-containing protein [Pseudodesulfovibrio sediminis]BCS87425.1 hypothetical protein PSDVSF_06670 [Pseudodesulfovibrio sediminis]
MDLVTGDKILLELSTFEDRFLGVVADVKSDGRLLVYVSLPPLAVERIGIHTPALIRYAYDGQLLGFASEILNTIHSSGVILELAGPESVFDAEERSEPRCVCRFPASIEGEGHVVQGVVEDMSASCARMHLFGDDLIEFPEDPGRVVKLTFHPFDKESEAFSVGCAVVKAFLRNGERFAVVRFNNDEPDTRKRISGFVEAQVCCFVTH